MSAMKNLSRRVVVLDPVLRTREHLRRAVRALGHAPLLFNDAEELLPLREGLQRCAAVCIGLPHDLSEVQSWTRAVRNVVGPDVPLLFVTRENPLKAPGILRCGEGDLVLAAPTCFADIYTGLAAFLKQNAIASLATGPTWGGYRFDPRKESVVFDHSEIHLRPLDFAIAMEFFHNINRVLSRDWLRSMAGGLAPDSGGRWLDGCVGRLRTQLGFAAYEGCEWQLSSIRYGGFKLSRLPGKKQTKLVALPEILPQSQISADLPGSRRLGADAPALNPVPAATPLARPLVRSAHLPG